MGWAGPGCWKGMGGCNPYTGCMLMEEVERGSSSKALALACNTCHPTHVCAFKVFGCKFDRLYWSWLLTPGNRVGPPPPLSPHVTTFRVARGRLAAVFSARKAVPSHGDKHGFAIFTG